MSIKGKTAIVTGSTSGIGLAIAHGLAKAGVNVVVNGLGAPDEIAKAVDSVKALGVKEFMPITVPEFSPDAMSASFPTRPSAAMRMSSGESPTGPSRRRSSGFERG